MRDDKNMTTENGTVTKTSMPERDGHFTREDKIGAAKGISIAALFLLLCAGSAASGLKNKENLDPANGPAAIYVSEALPENAQAVTWENYSPTAPGADLTQTTGGQTTAPIMETSGDTASASQEGTADGSTSEAANQEKMEKEIKEAVFGKEADALPVGSLQSVSGMTDREKRLAGFNEADFIKKAGAFLSAQKISSRRIIIEDGITCSSENAMAFRSRLEGNEAYVMDITFFPQLPGEYLFLLRRITDNENADALQEAGEATLQTESAAAPQSEAPLIQPQDAGQSTSGTSGEERNYDATQLSIRKIPETLLNYIDNRYELQYELYDYLYRNGKRGVKSATVTDYSIDGDTRTLVFTLSLDDGSAVTGTYAKTGNTYTFSR